MKIFLKKTAALALAVFLFGIFLVPLGDVTAAARDCDSNALIYCGTLNKDELVTKLANGTGRQYQSPSELKLLFDAYGITGADFADLKDGYVTSDNRVILDGQTIQNDVYTMGRSYMAGSTRLTQFPFPIYQRHPSVSFRSSQVAAFISLNPNRTLKYAILKSCGNIVPGVPYTPQETPKYQIYALKWLDVDGDGARDNNETMFPGVSFNLRGNGVNQTLETDSSGYARFNNLDAGSYTLTELVPGGYRATTAIARTINATGPNGTVFGNEFGNQIIPPRRGSLQVYKFNDINGNRVQDNHEPSISGWHFRVVGPNDTEFELTTGENGYARRDNLDEGIYTVTEVLEDGWSATTDMSLHQNVTDGTVAHFVFGNRLFNPPRRTGGGESLPVSGPVAVATMAGSAALFSGSAVAWARSKKRFLHSFRK